MVGKENGCHISVNAVNHSCSKELLAFAIGKHLVKVLWLVTKVKSR